MFTYILAIAAAVCDPLPSDNQDEDSRGSWSLEEMSHSTQQFIQNHLGSFVRDNLFFPHPNGKFFPSVFEDCKEVFDRKKESLEIFKINDKTVPFTFQNRNFEANIRILETDLPDANKTHTCLRVGGSDETLDISNIRLQPFLTAFSDQDQQETNLRLIQLSFYEIHEMANNQSTLWQPLTFREVGQVCFSLVAKLKDQYTSIDSMICHSMGSAILDHLEEQDPDLVPKTLILDRVLPSVWKAGNNLNPVVQNVFYFLAYMSNWTGSPEESITKFFTKIQDDDPSLLLQNREVISIEVENDYYFSGEGAFDEEFSAHLEDLGVNVSRFRFSINPLVLHYRAHHACPITFLENRTNTPMDGGGFSIPPQTNVVQTLVRKVFLRNP